MFSVIGMLIALVGVSEMVMTMTLVSMILEVTVVVEFPSGVESGRAVVDSGTPVP